MKYDYGHWDGGGHESAGSEMAPDDPFENHQVRVWPGDHKGGVHGMAVKVFHPEGATHTAADMSRVAEDYLKHLG